MNDKDFIDISDKEEIETLDFETDRKVSNEIDEMLDFIDAPQKDPKEQENLDKILNNAKSDKEIQIEASKEVLDDYEPSIKDFNIKSAKKRKLVRKVMVYTIIAMLIGFEFVIESAGNALNDLRVYASDNQPIKIVQNEKYGYIDYTGKKIVNPKYEYGEDFIKGYAIVKNSSNLPLIIDKGGKVVVDTGVYFSIYRAGTDIIASKITKSGLKYGVLNEDLKEKISFEYDSISYMDGVYAYSNRNEVGLINLSGKKIYTYKLSDSDDKSIVVSTSKTDQSDQKYGVVKINSTSLIVNLNNGKVVSDATLNMITPEENNVFYETNNDGTKKFMYVYNDQVLIESESYTSMTVESISSGVVKGVNNNFEYEYVSVKTLEQLSKGLKPEEVYEGENIFIYKVHNYKKNTNSFNLVKNGEVFKTIDNVSDIVSAFKNKAAIVRLSDGKYNFINEDGNLITEDHYDEVLEFDSYGDAVVKKDGYYGIINISGKVILDYKYQEVKQASSVVKNDTLDNNKNVFYAAREESKYVLFNKKGKKVNNTKYNDVLFDSTYGVIKVATDSKDILITTEDMMEINLTSFNTEFEAYENYIIIKNEYYNYDGKLIYVDNRNK